MTGANEPVEIKNRPKSIKKVLKQHAPLGRLVVFPVLHPWLAPRGARGLQELAFL